MEVLVDMLQGGHYAFLEELPQRLAPKKLCDSLKEDKKMYITTEYCKV